MEDQSERETTTQRTLSLHRQFRAFDHCRGHHQPDRHGQFKGYSAGSMPAGHVHPMALELLNRLNYDTSGKRSKSWEEFTAPGAPELDFVFTVCETPPTRFVRCGRVSR